MQTTDHIRCATFPCSDVNHSAYQVPGIEIEPQRVKIVLISEAAPTIPADGYYAGGASLFEQTTLEAFHDAGIQAASIKELLDQGFYFTTAVKCAKTGYGICSQTIQQCSQLLENELALFPNVSAYLLMGDVAIKALNSIARRQGLGKVIPVGSTYKIRGGEFTYHGKPVLPSYLQAGPSFYIERSKRRMIAEDIAHAIQHARTRLE